MPSSEEKNSPTILCVDDEENQLTVRKFLLQNAGYQVVLASSCQAGMDAFEAQPIDLALIDYWMPGGNGLQLAWELKQHCHSLPVVILSAYSELPGESIGLADAWITKGLDSEVLLKKIAELLGPSTHHPSINRA